MLEKIATRALKSYWTYMTRFTPGFAFAGYYRFTWVAAAEQLGAG